jgi:hypothetical protein
MTLDEIKEYYKQNGYTIEKFNLIGFRDSSNIEKDVINDKLGFFTENELFLCSGTTDPSVYWTTSKERNKAGTFHLLEGYHKDIWTFGKHKGYDALVNDPRKCRPTKGWRDANYNFVRDAKDVVVCDYFGVNFHRMSESVIAKLIGKYSAGCQVVQSIKDFNYIYSKAKESEQETFSYMLFKA